MRIGFVSTWFERGAAYVTRAYFNALKSRHECLVYARGGEDYAQGDPAWDGPHVTWGRQLGDSYVAYREFRAWVRRLRLDVVFFNEQQDFVPVFRLRRDFPALRLGTYVDYYRQDTLPYFEVYDFLICNTQRHHSVFTWHPSAHYVPWGTDLDLYCPSERPDGRPLTFFHSSGMAQRKGTDLLVRAWLATRAKDRARLLIHTQANLTKALGIPPGDLAHPSIEIVHATIPAPGLYHRGDIYAYPTLLDGLGLTMYEALACGLPVIATDYAPMNEVVTPETGRLVPVAKTYTRADGYYWPLTECGIGALTEALDFFAAEEPRLAEWSSRARRAAVAHWDWSTRTAALESIFAGAKPISHAPGRIAKLERDYMFRNRAQVNRALRAVMPDSIRWALYRIGRWARTKHSQ